MEEMIRTFTLETGVADHRGFVAEFRPGPLLPRDRVHREGHWHQMVHIHLINRSGLILQRRLTDHEFWPGMIDAAVVGHVEGDEAITTTAIRETGEEIGIAIKASDLISLGRFLSFHSRGDLLDLEILHVFLLESETSLEDLVGSVTEVEELVAVPRVKAREYLFAPWTVRHPYFPMLLERLTDK
jgi:isopentenyldiphosphate isomerase